MDFNRRDFVKIAGLGGVVFASGSALVRSAAQKRKTMSFIFVQLSDTHLGFDGPKVNPDAQGTLKKSRGCGKQSGSAA